MGTPIGALNETVDLSQDRGPVKRGDAPLRRGARRPPPGASGSPRRWGVGAGCRRPRWTSKIAVRASARVRKWLR